MLGDSRVTLLADKVAQRIVGMLDSPYLRRVAVSLACSLIGGHAISYKKIAYPMGDVADDRGVCTDLVIRAYRRLGIDLQVLIHEDMVRDFSAYPRTWSLPRPDRNIDHRRVPNMQSFLQRARAALPVRRVPEAYLAGDLVTWMLPGNLPHIGIVSNRFVAGTRRPKIIHNIGRGPVEEDMLFAYPITGHYRYAQ